MCSAEACGPKRRAEKRRRRRFRLDRVADMTPTSLTSLLRSRFRFPKA